MISPEANNFETNNLIIYHIITAFILIYKLKKCSAALSEHFKWASACRLKVPAITVASKAINVKVSQMIKLSVNKTKWSSLLSTHCTFTP